MPDVLVPLLWLLLGYLAGSIPSAYLAGRLIKGIDIRDYGSGNVGGANVMSHVARWAFVPVVLVDVLKAVHRPGPPYRRAQLGGGCRRVGAVAATAGHSTSFTGGRGCPRWGSALVPPASWVVILPSSRRPSAGQPWVTS